MRRKVGDVSPDEYDWKQQIDSLDTRVQPFQLLDVGKVRGLGIALEDAQERIAALEAALKQPVWEVSVSDGTSMSGGVQDSVLVRASSEADAIRIGRQHLDGSGWPEYSARQRALRVEASGG